MTSAWRKPWLLLCGLSLGALLTLGGCELECNADNDVEEAIDEIGDEAEEFTDKLGDDAG